MIVVWDIFSSVPSDNDRVVGLASTQVNDKQHNVKYKKQPIVLFAVENLVSIGKQVMTDHKGDDQDTRFLSILGVNSNLYYKQSKLNSMFVVSFLIFYDVWVTSGVISSTDQ